MKADNIFMMPVLRLKGIAGPGLAFVTTTPGGPPFMVGKMIMAIDNFDK